MRTWLYIDGYNFYLGLRRGENQWPIGLGWCNFRQLAGYFLKPGDVLERIRYFTAPVRSEVEESKGEAARQRIWLAALRTICGPGDIIRGRHAKRPGERHRKEKMTDVRIAVELILDGLSSGGYEKALILTSDQDLFPAAHAVKSRLPTPKQVEFVFSPDTNPGVLKRYCRAHKIRYWHIRPEMLLMSRFASELRNPSTGRKIVCRREWNLPEGLASMYRWARSWRGSAGN